MCGRYGFVPGEDFYKKFDIKDQSLKLETHYNVAPGMRMPVILRESPFDKLRVNPKKAEMMKWGLIPFWSKDPKIGYKMINARAEGIESKPSFRKPFRSQRCLIPTSFFFEWKRISDKEKIPYVIKLKNDNIFTFAGLYDIWKDAEGYPLKTFTIITTEPNSLVSPIHNRMPVILGDEFADLWLDPEVNDVIRLVSLLKPYDETKMEAHPVSKLVNSPANDNEEIIKPDLST